MNKLASFRSMAIRTLMVCMVAPSLAQPSLAQPNAFPGRPLTFVVPSAPGSTLDQLARAVGQAIATDTKISVVVENKPGGNFNIAAQTVARAAPDGYTVFFTSNTSQVVNPHLFQKLPYDPVKDFTPVAALALGSYVLLARNDLEVNSVGELLGLAKAKPGKVTFGSGTSATRVAGELFQQLSGTSLLHVPYKSVPFVVTDLLGGQIDLGFIDTVNALPHMKAGKLKPLGVTTAQRSPLAPDVPTIAEAGVKGYELTFWVATYVPVGTPAPRVEKLNELMARAARNRSVASIYRTSGMDPFITSPEELRHFQAVELEKWGRIIKAAGIKPE